MMSSTNSSREPARSRAGGLERHRARWLAAGLGRGWPAEPYGGCVSGCAPPRGFAVAPPTARPASRRCCAAPDAPRPVHRNGHGRIGIPGCQPLAQSGGQPVRPAPPPGRAGPALDAQHGRAQWTIVDAQPRGLLEMQSQVTAMDTRSGDRRSIGRAARTTGAGCRPTDRGTRGTMRRRGECCRAARRSSRTRAETPGRARRRAAAGPIATGCDPGLLKSAANCCQPGHDGNPRWHYRTATDAASASSGRVLLSP